MSRQHIHQTLARLDPAWIVRARDEADAHSISIALSDTGRALWKRVRRGEPVNEGPWRDRQSSILPPRGLLLALLGQVPLLVVEWPLRPGLSTLATGVVLLATGMILNVLASRGFKRRAVGICPFSDVPALVEDGPFRFTRNPMYLGLVALNAGFTFVTGALSNLWVSVAVVAWRLTVRRGARGLPASGRIASTFIVNARVID